MSNEDTRQEKLEERLMEIELESHCLKSWQEELKKRIYELEAKLYIAVEALECCKNSMLKDSRIYAVEALAIINSEKNE